MGINICSFGQVTRLYILLWLTDIVVYQDHVFIYDDNVSAVIGFIANGITSSTRLCLLYALRYVTLKLLLPKRKVEN